MTDHKIKLNAAANIYIECLSKPIIEFSRQLMKYFADYTTISRAGKDLPVRVQHFRLKGHLFKFEVIGCLAELLHHFHQVFNGTLEFGDLGGDFFG